jgi:hypothetical protein
MSVIEPLTWLVNGVLAVIYVLFGHVFILLLLPPLAYLVGWAPREHRPWIAASGILALTAAGLVPPPVPLLLTLLASAGALAVRLDRFSPKALRWRATGGLALYALAALGFSGYAAYASRIDSNAWAGLVAGGEAAAIVGQGRAFLSTLAVWGLWVILPVGYLALMLQGIFVHPPTSASPAALIHAVRGRGFPEAACDE